MLTDMPFHGSCGPVAPMVVGQFSDYMRIYGSVATSIVNVWTKQTTMSAYNRES